VSGPTEIDPANAQTERARTSRGPDTPVDGLPEIQMPAPEKRLPPAVHIVVWVLIALPALYQIGLLAMAIGGRFSYPYDLEWMEGGVLHHAQRIRDGVGIYVPPSMDFIPYLYTPLYPSVLALFGGAFGVNYTVGRAISIVALLGIAATAALQIPSKRHEHARRGPPWAGVALGLGLFSAAYPISEGWYDLVRGDTLFLLLVTVGIGTLPRWAKTGTGIAGHAQVGASATLLALAFFCKQTGVFYVALGGAIVLLLARRRLPAFIAIAALFGLGGTWALQSASDGWFWTYIIEIPKNHDFSMDRFWQSIGNILWRTTNGNISHPPIGAPITIVVVGSLILVAYTWRRHRVLPRQVTPLFVWSAAFGVSVIVGAIGWGKELAHFNHYMPAHLHGALAAGAALPAVHACVMLLWDGRPRAELAVNGITAGVALPLAITCIVASWSPAKYVPSERDVAAGDQLIMRLRLFEGEVWVPSHPWYGYMAGKTPRLHRMGIRDLTVREHRKIEGLEEALKAKAFVAILLDNHDIHDREHIPALRANYRPDYKVPGGERPRLYTGAIVVPDEIWLPIVTPKPPPQAKVLFDFEHAGWAGWTRTGGAWGNSPSDGTRPAHLVSRVWGTRFATSIWDGDKATGRLTSPEIKLDGTRLTVRLAGGTDTNTLRVELYVDGVKAPVFIASVPNPGGETLVEKQLTIATEHRGKTGRIVLVDDSTTSHLDVDDIWLWTD
jgi:hypothetical protein